MTGGTFLRDSDVRQWTVETDLRRKLGWLIAARAVVSTLLLGGAVVAQIKSPGSFPIDPFFILIATTYGLTIAYDAVDPCIRHRDLHRILSGF